MALEGRRAARPGETDVVIMGGLFHRLRELYSKEGGAYAEPLLNIDWAYRQPEEPTAEEIAQEYNGKALADVFDLQTGAQLAKAGELLPGFGLLRADGTTSSGCWIFCGSWTQAGNQMARRDNADPYGMGQTLGWAWAWPANRRILYNRASADPAGNPWDAQKKRLVWWDGGKWGGTDVPDFKVDSRPEDGMNPFIMNPEGGAAVRRGQDERGAIPRALRAVRDADRAQPAASGQSPGDQQPRRTGVQERHGVVRQRRRVPLRSDHLPSHRALPLLDQALPAQRDHPARAVRRDRRGAGQELGIAAGERVKVSSNRGYIKAVAVVTKRIKPLTVDGKTVHQIGIPLHWGFAGVARNGYLTNTLTPFVGDANTQTPEFKSFLVNVEKA